MGLIRRNVPPPAISGPGGDVESDNPVVVFRLGGFDSKMHKLHPKLSYITIHRYEGMTPNITPIRKRLDEVLNALERAKLKNGDEVRAKMGRYVGVDSFDAVVSLYIEHIGEKTRGPIVAQGHHLGVASLKLGKEYRISSGRLMIELQITNDDEPDLGDPDKTYAVYETAAPYEPEITISFEAGGKLSGREGKLTEIKSDFVDTPFLHSYTQDLFVTTGVWVKIMYHEQNVANDRLIHRYFLTADEDMKRERVR